MTGTTMVHVPYKGSSQLGATAVGVDSEPFAAYIGSETERWKKVIEAANIKME